MKRFLFTLIAGATLCASGSNLQFDYSTYPAGRKPPGFASLFTGEGPPASWKIMDVEVPPLLAPLSPNARGSVAKRAVLAAQSFTLSRNHLAVLLFTNEIFSDFTLTTRFQIVGGVVEPTAGVVFRAQDENNYYVVRASAEGNLLWYRVVAGKQYDMLGIGVQLPVSEKAWHELKVECSGTRIRCFLDGALKIPPTKPGADTAGVAINDTTFSTGKIGFWTSADSECYFVDTQIEYTSRVPYVQLVVSDVIKRYPRLLGLEIYANKTPGFPVLIGSISESGLGTPGTKVEADVINQGTIYYLKNNGAVEITLPLRDRNGDITAALHTKMKAFPGETQDTAVTRATVIKKAIERQIDSLQSLNE